MIVDVDGACPHHVDTVGILQAGLGVIDNHLVAVAVIPAAVALMETDRRPEALSLPPLTAAETFSSWSLWLLNPLLPRSGTPLRSPAGLFGDDVHQPAGTAAAVQRGGAGDHFDAVNVERIDRVELAAVAAGRVQTYAVHHHHHGATAQVHAVVGTSGC